MREGDSDVSRLERRARRLLLAYPSGYRADRGEEILGTLLETTPPGRDWPPARDLASVLGGGLRARGDANRRHGPAVSLRQAAILGIALVISCMLSSELDDLGAGPFQIPIGWKGLVLLLPLAAILAAAWSGRRWLATVTALAAGAAITYGVYRVLPTGIHLDRPLVTELAADLMVPLLLLAALVLIVGSTPPPPRSWLWLPWVSVVVAALAAIAARLPLGPAGQALAWTGNWGQGLSLNHLTLLVLVASVCWLVTDARPLLGLAFGFAILQFSVVLVRITSGSPRAGLIPTWQLYWPALVALAVPLAVASVLVWLLCRRTRISPPAGS